MAKPKKIDVPKVRKSAIIPTKVKQVKPAKLKTKAKKAKGIIPVRVVEDSRPVIVCPELEESSMPFRFRGQCPIITCQYCTKETVTGCMSLDRKESSDRAISNREIAYYKRGLFPEFKEMDQKQLDGVVRRAQTRTRTAICLSMYIASIDDSECDRSFQYVKGVSPDVDGVHNYMVQTFTDYRSWMLSYLNDDERFSETVGKISGSEFNLGSALRLTPRKYQTFCHALDHLKQSGDLQ